MRLRVILLVLAIGSLILVSFMLPLALLLRTFADNSAVSRATIRVEGVAPLLATVKDGDLRSVAKNVNQSDPSEPVTFFMPDGKQLGAPSKITAGVVLARNHNKSFSEPAPGGVAIFVAVTGIGPTHGTAVIKTFVPDSELWRGVTHAWLLLGLVAIGLLTMAALVAV